MTTMGIPFLLEDRTGDVLNTEFDELYDRLFFGVSSSPSAATAAAPRTIRIFELGGRSPAFSSSAPSASLRNGTWNFGRNPAVVMDFGPNNALGTILFVRQSVSMQMTSWMCKKGAGRCFACSDGENYTWTRQANDEVEWACTTANGYLVAQYKLCTPDEPKYANSSGNMFTVYESYGHIATELLASLTIVRYMHRHNISA